jgi:hypothetical protein
MDKLIIENRTEFTIEYVMDFVLRVIKEGKVSKTSKGEQYCFLTSFSNGIVIYADKNKKSDRLIVSKDLFLNKEGKE